MGSQHGQSNGRRGLTRSSPVLLPAHLTQLYGTPKASPSTSRSSSASSLSRGKPRRRADCRQPRGGVSAECNRDGVDEAVDSVDTESRPEEAKWRVDWTKEVFVEHPRIGALLRVGRRQQELLVGRIDRRRLWSCEEIPSKSPVVALSASLLAARSQSLSKLGSGPAKFKDAERERPPTSKQSKTKKPKELLNWVEGLLEQASDETTLAAKLESRAPSRCSDRNVVSGRRAAWEGLPSEAETTQIIDLPSSIFRSHGSIAAVASGVAFDKGPFLDVPVSGRPRHSVAVTGSQCVVTSKRASQAVLLNPTEAFFQRGPTVSHGQCASRAVFVGQGADPSGAYTKKDTLTQWAELRSDKTSQAAYLGLSAAEDFEDDVASPPRPVLSIDRGLALAAFRACGSGGELPAHRIGKALLEAGQREVNDVWVKEIVEEIGGRGHLDRSDFFDFIQHYEHRYRSMIEAEFAAADADGGGTISVGELSFMFRARGVTPVPGMVRDLVREVTGVPSSFEITLEEYVQIYYVLRERAGFTLAEAARLEAVYRRFDVNHDSELDSDELRLALQWMGFVTSQEDCERLICDAFKIEANSSETKKLSLEEFLHVCRKHREHDISKYMEAFGTSDEEKDGSVSPSQLPHVFERLGYLAASPAVIAECRELCGMEGKRGLEFEDLYTVLEKFRERDGFLSAELQEIRSVFDSFAEQRADEFGVWGLRLAKAVKWLGFPMMIEQVQDICEEFDLTKTGVLDFQEFRRLAARYREIEIRHVRRCFTKQAHEDKDGVERLSVTELRNVLLGSGFIPAHADVERLLEQCGFQGDEGLGIWDLVDFVVKYRRDLVEKIRASCGFTDLELKKLHKRFHKFDPHSTGSIARESLASLLDEIFPNARDSLSVHADVRDLVSSVDVDGSGSLDWQEYLTMMRVLQDREDEETLGREVAAAKATGFTREELRDFRKVFQMFDDDRSGDMSFGEFEQMIESIMPMGSAQLKELQDLMRETDDDENRVLDFSEFLRIMRRLQDANWHDINNKAAGIVEESPGKATTNRHKSFDLVADWQVQPSDLAEGAVQSSDCRLRRCVAKQHVPC